MSKQVYTLKLTPEADSANFLTQGAGSNYECIDAFPNMPRVFLFNLTEEEADYLQNLQEVEIVFTDELPEDDSPRTYGSATYTTSGRHMRAARAGFTLTGSGADYISDNYYHQTGIIPTDSNGIPTLPDQQDAFQNLFIDTATNVTGQHVDIVVVEVMDTSDPENNTNSQDMLSHIDMASAEDSTDSTNRITPIDWSDYNGFVDDQANNRITNPNVDFINNHGSASISVAAGKYCGAASSSNIYTMKLTGQQQAHVFSAIQMFHTIKNNPATEEWRGRPTATIVTNSWGYSNTKYVAVVPIEQIEEIQTSTTAVSGNWTTSATRPVAGWGTDLTPFINAGIVPRIANIDGTDQWVISRSSVGLNSTNTWFSIENSFDYSGTEGLYVFQSAGNSSTQAAKKDSPLCQSRVLVAENSYYATRADGSSLTTWRTLDDDGNLIPTQQITTNGGQWWYPNKAHGAGSTDVIEVGAAQHRSAEGDRTPNNFSTRGQAVDIFAGGTHTWAAGYSSTGAAEDGRWGWYGGTSCACPVTAGIAACFLQDYYNKYSKYPTQEKLLQILKKNAKASMQENDDNYWSEFLQPNIDFDWSNVTYASNTVQGRSISATGVMNGFGNMLKLSGNANGGPKRFDMIDTTTDRVFLPYGIRMGNGIQITEPRGRMENKRPTSGQTYPRRKVRIGS